METKTSIIDTDNLSRKNNASSFANWVYRQTNSNRIVRDKTKAKKLKEMGRETHLHIDNFFRMKWTNANLQSESASDWNVKHSEIDGRNGIYYKSSCLKLDGKSMNCSPDLILTHKYKNQAVVIERKTTQLQERFIPRRGWPNVQAQLWCYSWMDILEDYDEVILVGQIWRRYRYTYVLCTNHSIWRKQDKRFHQYCLNWFNEYGGNFINEY